jgi:predicted amidohydrolase YtcJ
VEAGFTPVEAIHIATSNGAQFLGEAEHIGTLVPGKQADMVVIHGNPSTNINDIENVEIVFKDGMGWDGIRLRKIDRVSTWAGGASLNLQPRHLPLIDSPAARLLP